MAQKRSRKQISRQISPIVWGYICLLKKQGVPIKKAYVFGSWAKNTQHKWSDIDVAIISPKFTTWNKRHRALYKAKLIEEFNIIEPHGFHPNDFVNENPVVWEIKKHGIRMV